MGTAGMTAVIVAGMVVLFVAGGVAVRMVIGRVRQRVGEQLLATAPRAQPMAFVIRLREMVFKDPGTVMERLWDDGREAFVRQVWREVGAEVRRVKLREQLKGAGDEAEFTVRPLGFQDGRALVVVTLPKAERAGEAHMVAVALPRDPAMKQDVARAREAVRFFVLQKCGGGAERQTHMCEWTQGGRKKLTYNVAAPVHDVGFAEVMWGKLKEMGR